MSLDRPDSDHPVPERFQSLLRMMGPDDAIALLRQFRIDLAECDVAIAAAVPAMSLATLRRASHNLVALAGTAGADRLQQLAFEMNQAAHAADRARINQLGAALAGDLAALTKGITALLADRVPL